MNSKRVNLLTFLIFLFCHNLVIAAPSSDLDDNSLNQKLKMALVRKPHSYDGLFAQLVYNEAFRRVGRELEIGFYSARRANILIESGSLDGDLARMPDFSKFYPHMIKVEEPTLRVRFSAFTTDPTLKIEGWHDLLDSDYRIECIRGQKVCDEYIEKVSDKQITSQVTHWSQGLNKLALGRSDIFIGVERTILHALNNEEFSAKGIVISGVMEEFPIHIFLDVKHKALAKQLSQALIEMKKEGLIKKYGEIAEELNNSYLSETN